MLLTVTIAPATTAPDASSTLPEMAALTWALEGKPIPSANKPSATLRNPFLKRLYKQPSEQHVGLAKRYLRLYARRRSLLTRDWNSWELTKTANRSLRSNAIHWERHPICAASVSQISSVHGGSPIVTGPRHRRKHCHLHSPRSSVVAPHAGEKPAGARPAAYGRLPLRQQLGRTLPLLSHVSRLQLPQLGFFRYVLPPRR